jgi:hypothetical protein
VLDKVFLRGCPGTFGRAARFAAAEGCGRAVALLPSAHVFARLLKLALLARFRQLRLIQYHHSKENALSPRQHYWQALLPCHEPLALPHLRPCTLARLRAGPGRYRQLHADPSRHDA